MTIHPQYCRYDMFPPLSIVKSNTLTGDDDDDDDETETTTDSTETITGSTSVTSPSKQSQRRHGHKVSFNSEVQIREYERILCDHPISLYAGFVLGWGYCDAHEPGCLSGGDHREEGYRNQEIVQKSSGNSSVVLSCAPPLHLSHENGATKRDVSRRRGSSTELTADTAKSDCWSYIAQNRRKNECRSTIRAIRYSPSERMKILGGYGYAASEIVKIEKKKRHERCRLGRQALQQDDDCDCICADNNQSSLGTSSSRRRRDSWSKRIKKRLFSSSISRKINHNAGTVDAAPWSEYMKTMTSSDAHVLTHYLHL